MLLQRLIYSEAYEEKYGKLKEALQGDDIDYIRKMTLEVLMNWFYPAEVSRLRRENHCGLCIGLYDEGTSK